MRAHLIEAAQEDGACHDGDVVAQGLHEASALQRNVRGADDQCLARGRKLAEDVIAGDAALLVA